MLADDMPRALMKRMNEIVESVVAVAISEKFIDIASKANSMLPD